MISETLLPAYIDWFCVSLFQLKVLCGGLLQLNLSQSVGVDRNGEPDAGYDLCMHGQEEVTFVCEFTSRKYGVNFIVQYVY